MFDNQTMLKCMGMKKQKYSERTYPIIKAIKRKKDNTFLKKYNEIKFQLQDSEKLSVFMYALKKCPNILKDINDKIDYPKIFQESTDSYLHGSRYKNIILKNIIKLNDLNLLVKTFESCLIVLNCFEDDCEDNDYYSVAKVYEEEIKTYWNNTENIDQIKDFIVNIVRIDQEYVKDINVNAFKLVLDLEIENSIMFGILLKSNYRIEKLHILTNYVIKNNMLNIIELFTDFLKCTDNNTVHDNYHILKYFIDRFSIFTWDKHCMIYEPENYHNYNIVINNVKEYIQHFNDIDLMLRLDPKDVVNLIDRYKSTDEFNSISVHNLISKMYDVVTILHEMNRLENLSQNQINFIQNIINKDVQYIEHIDDHILIRLDLFQITFSVEISKMFYKNDPICLRKFILLIEHIYRSHPSNIIHIFYDLANQRIIDNINESVYLDYLALRFSIFSKVKNNNNIEYRREHDVLYRFINDTVSINRMPCDEERDEPIECSICYSQKETHYFKICMYEHYLCHQCVSVLKNRDVSNFCEICQRYKNDGDRVSIKLIKIKKESIYKTIAKIIVKNIENCNSISYV